MSPQPGPPHFILAFFLRDRRDGLLRFQEALALLSKEFSYRIFWILREVMLGLIIRFSRESSIKDRLSGPTEDIWVCYHLEGLRLCMFWKSSSMIQVPTIPIASIISRLTQQGGVIHFLHRKESVGSQAVTYCCPGYHICSLHRIPALWRGRARSFLILKLSSSRFSP